MKYERPIALVGHEAILFDNDATDLIASNPARDMGVTGMS